jgi:hypothetical protein
MSWTWQYSDADGVIIETPRLSPVKLMQKHLFLTPGQNYVQLELALSLSLTGIALFMDR